MNGWVIKYRGLKTAFGEAWVGNKGVITYVKAERHAWHYKKDAITAASCITDAEVEVVRA